MTDKLREKLRKNLRWQGLSQFEIAMELREYDWQKAHFVKWEDNGSLVASSV